MRLVQCRYCSRRVDGKSLMRHYTLSKSCGRAISSVARDSSAGCDRYLRRHQSHLQPRQLADSDSCIPAPEEDTNMSDAVPQFTPPASSYSVGHQSEDTTRHPRVWLEEIPNEGDFPIHSRVTDVHPTAGQPFSGTFKTDWEKWQEKQTKEKTPVWAPFASADEWGFAKYLMKSGLSQEKIDELLHLQMVCQRVRCTWPILTSLLDYPPTSTVFFQQIRVLQEDR